MSRYIVPIAVLLLAVSCTTVPATPLTPQASQLHTELVTAAPVTAVADLTAAVETPVAPAPTETQAPAPAELQAETPTAIAAAVAVVSATAAPSATAVPSAAPTETAAPTITLAPTPLVPSFVVASASVNVRSGPGTVYAVIAALRNGEGYPITGRSESPVWWQFDLPPAGDGTARKGWVTSDLAKANVPAEEIEVVADIPPTPQPAATVEQPPTSAPAASAYNLPGIYPFTDRCYWAPITGANGCYAKVCIESVEVLSDGNMRFNMSWMAQMTGGAVYLIKGSDRDNRNMYLTDDLGNRYDHIETGGAADAKVNIKHSYTVTGWFVFLPPAAGARSFTFFDDDQHLTIEGIVLTQPRPGGAQLESEPSLLKCVDGSKGSECPAPEGPLR